MRTLEYAPKYIKIREELRHKIETGILSVDEKIPTEAELMQIYGVSRNTVSNAVKDMVNEGLLVRTIGKGTFVARPEPELSAREVVGLAMRTTGDLYEAFSSRLVRGLMAHHLFPLVIDLFHDQENGYVRTQTLVEKQPPFLVFDSSTSPIPEHILSEYQGHVIFVHQFDHKEIIPASYVLSDMRRGAVLAAEHLLDAGYRRIVHYAYVDKEKKRCAPGIDAGIKFVLKNRGLPDGIFSCWLEDEGKAAIEERLRKENQPTALIASGDYRLEPVYEMLARIGLRIPEDFGLVGWNNTPWCKAFHPHLTSVSIREDLMADKVIEVITNKDMRGKKIWIPPELVVRESTGRCD